ncbi:MAG: Mur ligase family protein [Candidatus Omnitrophica bacterium]|nr:Mur ligase family protein [Candidatus Omnitrophota bacterium]HOX55174.1 Mur ligase family protein [Candidatus Omnitrophota bacterium]
MNFKNKTITVFGLARSGLDVALLLSQMKEASKIKITDVNDNPVIRENAKKLPPRIEAEIGRHSEDFIKDSDIIVISPGIRTDLPILEWARQKGIKVIGEIELGFLLCPAPIVAVTGTNGKTTVTTLSSQILKLTGKNVHLCGNIGNPFSREILKIKKDDLVCLEVSSFQLETIETFKPNVAVFLNLSRNHLDRYNNMQEYLAAKKRIFINQDKNDWAVLNYEDESVRNVSKAIKSQIVFFNTQDDKKEDLNSNFLAAMAVGRIFGVKKEKCLEVFRDFKGIEHRLEWVRNVDGIDFINDSKSTTIEATIWALNNINKPIIMIAGGREKGSDFSTIKQQVGEKVKEIILIGEAKQKIKKALEGATMILEAESLQDSVSLARRDAKRGDIILFSPMCKSFDMFIDFEDRGKKFKEIVRNI